MTSPKPFGLMLRAYLAASRAIPLAAPRHLQKRLAKGKELPDRWREKLGEPTLPRPDGPLIWLHAVGLGEVLALRGLIAALAERSEAQFLVTSTTRASAEVLAANLPPRTRHQFLPLDAPGYLHRFLDHWQPSLSVWAEQDLWPGAVAAASARGIPLALVNARMNADAYARRRHWRGLYADLLARFAAGHRAGRRDGPAPYGAWRHRRPRVAVAQGGGPRPGCRPRRPSRSAGDARRPKAGAPCLLPPGG